MGKRKDDETASESNGPPAKRPRRSAATTNMQQNIDHPRICQEIYEVLRNYKSEDGRVLCEPFLRAPSRRISPEYHKLVANPIDFMRIQQKLKTDEYDTVDQFGVDFRLLFENAKSFYKKNSQEYKDACQLMSVYNEVKSKYFEADEASEASGRSRDSSPAPSTRSLRSNSPSRSVRSKDTSPGRFCVGGSETVEKVVLENYLASVLALTDESGRRMCQAFKLLPSKEDYPDYYEVIKDPIDLKIVAGRLRADCYRCINDIEKDLTMMCRNAKIFNEPRSLIYKDANFIKKFVATKRSEMLETAGQPIDKNKVSANAELIDELLQQMTVGAVDVDEAFIQENVDEDSDDEDEDGASRDKFQTLYQTLRSTHDDDALDATAELSEPFLRLPSKAFYPDYYDEIKQPMSLFIINRKIKNHEYRSFEEMVADVNLMFNNAKLYNIEGSTVYMNACKLQSIGNFKAQELDPSIDTSQYVMDVPFDVMYGGDTEDSEQGTRSPVSSPTLKIGKPPRSSRVSNAGDKPRGRPGRKSLDELMIRYRNKLLMLYNAVCEYADVSGRVLCDAFMEKPSKKLYPDYYDVIDRPVDLHTIMTNIEGDKYTNTSQMAEDFELLFNNARTYNQENSQIFNDANTLEWIFKNSLRQLGPAGVESPKVLKEKFGWRTLFSWSKVRAPGGPSMKEGAGSQGGGSDRARAERALEKAAKKAAATRQKKMLSVYNAIKDYKDSKGTVLSTIFMKLPSKTYYPDYYEIIKKPIDMQKIHAKLMSGNNYESLDTFIQDFMLMFDNACKYNDPESSIYKDALSLQRVLLQKKSELKDEESIGKVPDVQTAVRELLTNLFISVYNHQDADGRSFSDSLAELPDLIRDKLPHMMPISLDDIKRNLEKGRYRRLDRFQTDVFDVFEKARLLSRSDSEIFEDAVELQQFFIKTRDELCKNGKYFFSPALAFDRARFAAILETQRRDKQQNEHLEDESQDDDVRLRPSDKKDSDIELDTFEFNGITYKKGDFVYIKRNDDKLEPHIMRILRLWRDESQRLNFVSGTWYYRPYETFHLASRKFLEKEVFRTDIYDTVDVERLLDKCYVLFIRDYFKSKPQGFEDKDIYCCESKYLGRMKHSFKKMKYWHIDMSTENVVLEDRPMPLIASRIPSVFVSEQCDEFKHLDEKDSDDEDYSVLEVKREESRLDKVDEAEPGAVFYEQLCENGMWFKLGDGVYLKTDKTMCDIVRVDRLWRNADGCSYLAGVWFARPQDLNHEQQRLFYKKELFATDRVDISPLAQVIGKCFIMSFNEYCTSRPAELREQDIYICESTSASAKIEPLEHAGENSVDPNEASTTAALAQQVSRKFTLVALSLSEKVLRDEFLYFKIPVMPEKVSLAWHLQEESAAAAAEQQIHDIGSVVSDLDKSELSLLKFLQSNFEGLTNTPKLGARSKSGYILFSAVVRKKIMKENPECPFGVISKLVGAEWKKLTDEDKKRYEEEASKIAAAREKADLAQGGRLAVQPGQIRVWTCKWRDCDYQFETSDQLYEHITNAHTSQIMEGGENQFVCLWLTCAKYRKDGKTIFRPFPSLPRLHRHMKEKHVPSSSKCILPQNKSKHYVPVGATSPPPSTPQPCTTPANQMISNTSFTSPTSSTVNSQCGMQQQIVHMAATQPSLISQGGQSQVIVADSATSGQVVIYQVQQTQAAPQPALMSAAPVVVQNAPPQGDPGRVVVQASKPAEPVFVVPPQRIQRVLHSEVYLKYLESLGSTQQMTISKFSRYLAANRSNTPTPSGRLPTHFFNQKPESKEDAVQALWNLRDHLMCDSLQLKRVLSPEEY